jgi:hypothetical protein
VNFPWAIRLARRDAAAFAPLRLRTGLEIGEAADSLWLRGPAGESELELELRKLPAEFRSEWLPDGRLRPLESRIPSLVLPALRWEPLRKWLAVELPAANWPGERGDPVSLRLARSAEEAPANVLRTRLVDWLEFAQSAAEVRLQRLTFAVSAERQVLVRGTPLPPLAGERFVERAGIAVPAGLGWQPAVSVEVIRRVLGVAEGGFVLWEPDNTVTRLHPEQFVAATRRAVRATAEAFRSP